MAFAVNEGAFTNRSLRRISQTMVGLITLVDTRLRDMLHSHVKKGRLHESDKDTRGLGGEELFMASIF